MRRSAWTASTVCQAADCARAFSAEQGAAARGGAGLRAVRARGGLGGAAQGAGQRRQDADLLRPPLHADAGAAAAGAEPHAGHHAAGRISTTTRRSRRTSSSSPCASRVGCSPALPPTTALRLLPPDPAAGEAEAGRSRRMATSPTAGDERGHRPRWLSAHSHWRAADRQVPTRRTGPSRRDHQRKRLERLRRDKARRESAEDKEAAEQKLKAAAASTSPAPPSAPSSASSSSDPRRRRRPPTRLPPAPVATTTPAGPTQPVHALRLHPLPGDADQRAAVHHPRQARHDRRPIRIQAARWLLHPRRWRPPPSKPSSGGSWAARARSRVAMYVKTGTVDINSERAERHAEWASAR